MCLISYRKLEKMQLVKINLFASTPFTTAANRNSMLPGHGNADNPRGMGEAALLPVHKTRVLIYHFFHFLYKVNWLWPYSWPKICCSTEGN